MASGGHKPKMSSSEPRQRSGWQRTTSMSDKEDNISLSSMPNELRPNNWDRSDWRPSSQKDQTKRRKKGNPEWEREQSHASQESPPPSERQHTTPRTFPRTKISPSTPTAQRAALENLRQHITFSDIEDSVSNDGERNNERNLAKRSNYTPQDRPAAGAEGLTRPIANRKEERNNRNNNKQNRSNEDRGEGKPDSSQIVGRLMQIRDYIKQAGSMMESLRKSGDPRENGNKVAEILSYWRKQEIQCLDTLRSFWVCRATDKPGYRDEMDRLQRLMDHLREQERGYTGLLQNLLTVREENGVNDMSREMTPNLDPMDETASIDLDIQSEMSDREERSASASSRPRIEDNLGLTPENGDDDDEDEDEAPSESSENSSTLDDTVISGRRNQEWDFELGEEELALGGVKNPKEAAETLAALKQQQELLTKLVEQQEQMRALRGRQAALLALQQDAETKLASARQKSNDARAYTNTLEEAASRADVQASLLGATGGRQDPELQNLRQQLQYLRNELKSQNQNLEQAESNVPPSAPCAHRASRPKNVPPPRPPSPKLAERTMGRQQPVAQENQPAPVNIPPNEMSKEQLQAKLQELLNKRDRLDELLQDEFSTPIMSGLTPEEMNHDQVQNKLLQLQAKKRRMDDMLNELHALRTNTALPLNNAAPVTPQPSPVPASTSEAAEESIRGSEKMAGGLQELLDARQKLQKLNEVKDRLSKMKSLVHYYQSVEGPDGQQGDDAADDQSSLPAYSDYGDNTIVAGPSRDTGARNRYERIPVQETATKPKQNITLGEESDEENNSSSSSESESQLSSLGPWGDDPEIQEKIRKLKAAKEKLKHLQNLVAMVQHSPEVAGELPDNLAEIAASIEDVESQMTQTDDRNNASVSEGEVPVQAEGDSFYRTKMEEQLQELDQLKDEKERLLSIQSQLQGLHDRFQQADVEGGDLQEVEDEDEEMPRTKLKVQSKSPRQSNNQRQEPASQPSTGPSVTFSSNEEVYNKMRNQRMLREELREKKKQLESIMKKDRNKKQYYKNQDNQSDTVSYSTEAFGANASVDATMATWGGSTVDNLESITEDGAADPQDDEDEDAYPSDGILQVEEEEEENNSDNETYTIEEDVRQRRKARAAMARTRAEGPSRRPKRSFPRPGRQAGTRLERTMSEEASYNKWLGNRKSKQENYRSPEDIVQDDDDSRLSSKSKKTTVEALQNKLEQTALLCQSLLGDQQAAGQLTRQPASALGSHSQLMMPDLQQQLQQQQLMMSVNQVYQQISLQQMEMQNMQRQMQNMVYQMSTENADSTDAGPNSDLKIRSSMPSLFSPMFAPRPSPGMLQPDQFHFSPVFPGMSPAGAVGGSRLLRRAVNEESDDAYTPDASELLAGNDHYRTFSARASGARPKTDSYKAKKRSPSPAQAKNNSAVPRSKSASTQIYEEEEPDPALRFEQYLARQRRDLQERGNYSDRGAGQFTETGVRRASKSQGAGDGKEYRPGLSAGISGAGYQEDGRSVISSSAPSSVAVLAQALNSQTQANRADVRDIEDPSELSLFETLRESIYSEVATLISQNENRPHYLIELFRELQLLTTDYLRQRVLYDIKDVVSKYLVEENAVPAPPPPWINPTVSNFTASELTPSESLVTSDDEEVKYLLQNKLKERVAANLVAKERSRRTVAELQRCGSLKDDEYDYQEVPEVLSSVSTPSNSYWDSPFNKDPLSETAIHLSKTLERMREYEKKMTGKDGSKGKSSGRAEEGEQADMCSSSAMDQGSESSIASDSVPYPRIDTQQLDQQIKCIMTEVIPVIKEHMDNMCSPQLLAYIKRLVLSLTRQHDSGQEFGRFFHRQLGSILQDTLAKYEGRKMRECGEDLLVDMSEVLFNELAFFRLMQDLDDPLIRQKMRDDSQFQEEKDEMSSEGESDTTESSTANASDNQDDTHITQTEEEELGKARDDAFANETEIQDADDKDEDPESPFKGVQIELAPSETKPYSRIGSDEDDESADDESQSNEDPSETAVSINARRVNIADDVDEDGTKRDGDVESGKQELAASGTPGRQDGPQSRPVDQGPDADQGASSGKDGQSPELMNGDILNGDMEVITMDDLPASLTVMPADDLQHKVLQEQDSNTGASAVLNEMDKQEELAGDPQFLKQPDEASG